MEIGGGNGALRKRQTRGRRGLGGVENVVVKLGKEVESYDGNNIPMIQRLRLWWLRGWEKRKETERVEQPEVKEVSKTRDEEMRWLKVTLNDLFANVTHLSWLD